MDTQLLKASEAAEAISWRLLDLPGLATSELGAEPTTCIDALADELTRTRQPLENSASRWSVAAHPAGAIEVRERSYRSAHLAAVGEAFRFVGLVQEQVRRTRQKRASIGGMITRGLGINVDVGTWEVAKPLIPVELDDRWSTDFKDVPRRIVEERQLVIPETIGEGDPAAYVGLSKLWQGNFDTYKQARAFLKKSTGQIRFRRPRGNRIDVHAGDWAIAMAARNDERFGALDEGPEDKVVHYLRSVEDRKSQLQAKKRKS